MDVSIRDDGGNFNYRVCAVMTDHDKILATRDERSPFYYLPGGRVMIGETAEQAVQKKIGLPCGLIKSCLTRPSERKPPGPQLSRPK